MTVIEEFTHILEKEHEHKLIPFLKTLDKAQKKGFYPDLKKLYKYYSEFTGSSSYSVRWTNSQRHILGIAAFVCYNQKDFEATWATSILGQKTLSTILPWYCPTWFNKYIDNYVNQNFIPHFLSYNWYMDLCEQGYLQSNPQLIAKILPQAIFAPLNRGYDYDPGNLVKRKITLDEHIWYLFEHESSINWSDRYINVAEKTKDSLWIDTLKNLAGKKLDRKRLLKESIRAANKNHNQSLSGWFAELFIQLEPAKAELLALLDELLNALNSPHSKIVNTALKYLKDLSPDPEFSATAFLDHAPMVLSSEVKSAVASTLMILDKLAKKNSDLREQICTIACQAFMHQDDNLQIRAAKLIAKYGDETSELLKETLLIFYNALFLEARGLIAGFFNSSDPPEATPETEYSQSSEAAALVEIKMPQTFDEFIFLASQAFDQNEIYHFDLLPAALLKFQDEMTAANILKLAPAFQRAYKLLSGGWTASIGYLDIMLATFFMDFGQLLLRFYPKEAEPIKVIRASFIQQEEEKKAKNSWHTVTTFTTGIKSWNIFSGSLGYKPHKHILLNAFYLLERNIKLPLLSTPTQEPCWVSSLALVERLIAYQEANVIPGNMDLQVAIARCVKLHPEETLALTDMKLRGEYRFLISFLFGGDYAPLETYKLKTAWLVAALTRDQQTIDKRWFTVSPLADNYLTGEFDWSASVEAYTTLRWDHTLRKNLKVPATRKIIKVHFGSKQKTNSIFEKLVNKFLPNKNLPEVSLYELTELKYKFLNAEENDIKRQLCLNPHQPGLLLANIINKALRCPDESGDSEHRLIIYTLEILLLLRIKLDTMAHLLIATSLLSNNKTIKTYAAEIWIKGVNENTIESDVIGEILGTLEQIEMAPLKRFTDIVLSNMYQISVAHNRELEVLITACIGNLADKPLNNIKKLLEIYVEVLSVNKSKTLNPKVLEKLTLWNNNESLKKSIGRIKKQTEHV